MISYLCATWLSLLPCFHHPLHNQEQSNENDAITFAKFHKPACITRALAQEPTLLPRYQLHQKGDWLIIQSNEATRKINSRAMELYTP